MLPGKCSINLVGNDGSDGSVGIWHETYLVSAGGFENVYVNMPRTGLGAVLDLIPAAGHRQAARGRLGATGQAASESWEVYK